MGKHLLTHFCQELDTRNAYGFAFSPPIPGIRLYLRAGFKIVGKVGGHIDICCLLRYPPRADKVRIDLGPSFKHVERTKGPDGEVNKGVTSEKHSSGLDTDGSEGSGSKGSKSNVVEAEASPESTGAELDAFVLQASKSQHSDSETSGLTPPEPQNSDSETDEVPLSQLRRSRSGASKPEASTPGPSASQPSKTESSEPEPSQPSSSKATPPNSQSGKAPILEMFEFPLPPSSKRPRLEPAPPPPTEAQFRSWAQTLAALKELRRQISTERDSSSTFDHIQATIQRLERSRRVAQADAVYDAATIVKEGKTLKFVGDFSHTGVGNERHELGKGHRSGWERVEIVDTGPVDKPATEEKSPEPKGSGGKGKGGGGKRRKGGKSGNKRKGKGKG